MKEKKERGEVGEFYFIKNKLPQQMESNNEIGNIS